MGTHTTKRARALMLALLLWGVLCLEAELRAQEDRTNVQLPLLQDTSEGSPLIRTVSRFTGMQSLLAKDSLGRLYLAGQHGLRRFDGEQWTELMKGDQAGISALAIDTKDQVWVGNSVGLGCFKPQSDGSLKYESIMPLIPAAHRNLAPVWSIHALGEEVFFTTSDKVLRLAEGRIHVHEVPSMRRLFACTSGDGRLLVHSRGQQGLLVFTPGTQEPELLVPQTVLSALTGFHAVGFALQGEQGETVLCSYTGGCLILGKDGGLRRSGWETDAFLRSNEIEHALVLSDGNYAFATMRGGVLITDRNGKALQLLNKEKGGLLSNHAIALLENAPGRLVITTQKGMVEWDFRQGLSTLDERNQNTSYPLSMARFRGELWLGADKGLQRLIPSQDNLTPASFREIPSGNNYVRALLRHPKGLISIAIPGIRHFDTLPPSDGGYHVEIVGFPEMNGGMALIHWPKDRNLLASGTHLTVSRVHANGQVVVAMKPFANCTKLLADPSDETAALAMTADGALFRVYPEINDKPAEQLSQPAQTGVVHQFFSVGKRVILLADSGTWVLEAGQQGFTRAEASGPDGPRIWAGSAGGPGGWIVTRAPTAGNPGDSTPCHVLRPASPDPLLGWREQGRLQAVLPALGRLQFVFTEEDGVLWLCGDERILRVNTKLVQLSPAPEPSPVHWTAVRSDSGLLHLSPLEPLRIDGATPLEFAWCAPLQEPSGNELYELRLTSPGEGWTSVTATPRLRLERLSSGLHRLELRTLSPLSAAGKPISYEFVILPRWYETWYTRLGFLVVLSSAVLGLVKWNTRRLRQRQRVLEAAVMERTQALRASNVLLHEATLAKTQFVRTVSHELRNPIAGGRMMAELLLKAPLPETQHAQVDKLHGCLNYLKRLLDNTLDYSRLENGQAPYTLSRFDLHSLVRDTAALFEALADGRKLRFHVELPPEGSVTCLVEATHLQRVLVNFLSNAFKFTNEGTIRLRVLSLPPKGNLLNYRFEVRDTGAGVPENLRAHLFVPFVRDPIQKGEDGQQGAGLGLALCKRLAELSGARVGYEPANEGGSCFWVEWPLPPASMDPERPTPEERDFSSIRMLVVEDDPLQREALGQFLEQLGVCAHFAEDINAGESLLCGQGFDLALVDYSIGAYTGFNLVERCRARGFGGRPAPQFHLMTSQNLEDITHAARALDFRKLHRKPLSLADLYTLLHSSFPPSA